MVGAAASSAEQAKRRKYENLDSSFIFVPFGVESHEEQEPFSKNYRKGLSSLPLILDLGQRISLAIQRGNAASILGTVPRCGGFEDVLDFI
ncbi:jg10210 [Pararge aegeria aegeria]|uniref:Jg10210 protein n=1 Tax=Pararge aegeria aegeria TaxID=348720 RepID=A0A8S4SNZ6_9NEOP|nr:jg10210 [Pararge aegeria aegeria]